ncbi:MAG: undecaprenyl-diphosphate phosphatase [bacterium]|nr:undecaprenyl-diphosphate phosphatase [bacterium]
MEILQAVLLGIIEGLTEFLPISSTGHLIVAQDFIGYYDVSKMFTVVIQTGAIAAVIWFYRRMLWQLVKGLFNGDKALIRFWIVWVLATIPAGVFGLLFDSKLEAYAVPLTVAIALIVGGVVILLIEKYHHSPASSKEAKFETITFRQSVLIGLYQVLALIPGVSRSGATIMGGMLSGVDRVTATAFSFFLGIPVLLLAGAYKLLTDDISSVEGGTPAIIAGTIAAFVTALVVVSWLLKYVSRHDFKVFAYYRIVFGTLLLGLIATGTLG